MKRKPGRPPKTKTERRSETVSLRLKSNEAAALRKAAEEKGTTFSTWVRKALLDSAKKSALRAQPGKM
jgi:uncharacterized protein (DUF1778 family)